MLKREEFSSKHLVKKEIDDVVKNHEMFNLPNKPKLTQEEILARAEELEKQYMIAVHNEKRRAELESKIKTIFHANSNYYQTVQKLLKKNSQEIVSILADNIDIFPRENREAIARLLIEKAPQEAAPGLAENIGCFPAEIQEEIIYLLREKAPRKTASILADNIWFFPVEFQSDVFLLSLLLLDKAPRKIASTIAEGILYFDQKGQEEIACLLLNKAPREVIPILAKFIEFLPEKVQKEIKNKVVEILPKTDKEKLIESEKINPILYKGIDDFNKGFLLKEFIKTGSETFLLGKTLINNAILRIIPNRAFISWVNAYRAIDIWKEAGFNYVPIEPILRAYSCKDGKNVRVYSGILGLSAIAYFRMRSMEKYHKDVERQIRIIIRVLEEMGITHGHTHLENFCILHERITEGEIDWDKPPRVYCIDFDQSTNS